MQRIILPYGASPDGATPIHPTPVGPGLAPPKTGRDYLGALRRRAWLAGGVALTVGLLGAAVVLKLPAVYGAKAVIKVSPPQFNSAAAVILESATPFSRDENEQYILDLVAQLQGKPLADAVVRELGPAAGPDPAAEIARYLKSTRMPGTTYFQVEFESRDPARVARVLNALLNALKEKAKDESKGAVDKTSSQVREHLTALNKERGDLTSKIHGLLETTPEFGPDGSNRLEQGAYDLRGVLLQRQARLDELTYQRRLAEIWPREPGTRADSPHAEEIRELMKSRAFLHQKLVDAQSRARNPRSDWAVQTYTRELSRVLDRIELLRAPTEGPAVPDLAALQISKAGEEVRKLQEAYQQIDERLQKSAGPQQEFLGLLKQRELVDAQIAKTSERLANFDSVKETQAEPVRIEQLAVDPIAPSSPNRPLLIAVSIVFGLMLGVGLVCGLEAMDRSVKVPEHLEGGLGLPLLGVVPRMRRLADAERGGHIWTPGAPASVEADAFRNVRAGLVGLEAGGGPIVTLLVTSAKSGEGKSTTALNLAATFARSGERTVLVDCDLRRPSLAEAFDSGGELGLVDVLLGQMPWQRAVVRCPDVPSLDLLPAGRLGETPIEILGSLELRQIVAALAGHYRRVILDGPAVLGLADCRMLGQVVDATVLVVRSGVHEILPLRRAKSMLEGSQVRLAGLVFNGLAEDLQNWSSGPPRALEPPPNLRARRLDGPEPVGPRSRNSREPSSK